MDQTDLYQPPCSTVPNGKKIWEKTEQERTISIIILNSLTYVPKILILVLY